MRHYHVFVGMPGYLPDNEPEVYTTLKDARAAAKWHADGWRDFAWESEGSDPVISVTGSAKSGRYTVDRGEYTLPIYITIDPCTDRTCELETE